MVSSTRGRYALRVLIDIAENSHGEYIAMKDVAARQEISLKYLEKILPILVSHHLVEGIHGKGGGGYRLSRDPSEYTVGEILRLTENDIAPVTCLQNDALPCSRAANCRTLPMWEELDRRISEYLDSITLADLMRSTEAAQDSIAASGKV